MRMDNEVKIDYAPVLIPTLCRAEHFKRCIESLRKNEYAKYTDLYIGLDYPAKESHVKGYREIRDYLEKGIDGFANVYIIQHEHNVGLSVNWRAIRDKAYEKHDKFIYSEDDNEFAPNYLEYMNRCMQKYADDESIIAISGFNYPIDIEDFQGNVYLSNVYFSALGYGTWKQKREEYMSFVNMEYFMKLFCSKRYMKKLKAQSENQYCNFVKGMLRYTDDLIVNDKIRKCDLAYGIYMVSQDKKMVFPTVSKTKNWGYDGSGVNCNQLQFAEKQRITHRNFNTDCQSIDREEQFIIVYEENQLSQQEINQCLATFFAIDKKEVRRTTFAYMISRIIGIHNMQKLIMLMRSKRDKKFR